MVCNMAFRIDINSEGPAVVVYVAGRLSGDATKLLRETCDPIKAAFVLDLSKLLFADDVGVDVIREISEQGAKIRGASPFIQLLVDKAFSQEADVEENK